MADDVAKRWREESKRLKDAQDRYLDSLNAIHELAEFASKYVVELDKKVAIPISVKMANIKPKDEKGPRATVKGFVDTFLTVAKRDNPDLKVSSSQISQEKVGDEGANDGRGQSQSEGQKEGQDAATQVVELITKALLEYRSSLGEDVSINALPDQITIERPRTRTDLLLASLLIAAVSDFEVLFSAIASFFFQVRPEALRAQDAKVAWSEIDTYSSINDLRTHFINERVSQLMWGGFDEWMRWLGAQLKIKYENVSLDSDATTEVFQRRHIIVHSGGLVSAQYLAKVAERFAKTPNGSPLPVDIKYLASSLDRLRVLGIALTYLIRRKLCHDVLEQTNIDGDTLRLIFELLRQQRWEVVETVSSIVLPDMMNDYDRCSVRVNGWIAQKRMKGKDAIAKEVTQWDVSALQEIFKLAKKILMDEPAAVDLAEELLKRGILSRQMIDEWPLLDDIREKLLDRLAVTGEGSAEVKNGSS